MFQNLGGLISKLLASLGYGVVVHYNSASSKAETDATIQEITTSGGKAWAFQGDLTSVDEIGKLFALAKEKGKVTVAINTVGKVLKKQIVDVSNSRPSPWRLLSVKF